MAVAGPPMRDARLIIEDLVTEAEELHRRGAPAACVDELLAAARALASGNVLAGEFDAGWDDGQA